MISPRTERMASAAPMPRSAPRHTETFAAPPLPSNELLQGRKTVEISHNGSVYRLQSTKLGKLILTK